MGILDNRGIGWCSSTLPTKALLCFTSITVLITLTSCTGGSNNYLIVLTSKNIQEQCVGFTVIQLPPCSSQRDRARSCSLHYGWTGNRQRGFQQVREVLSQRYGVAKYKHRELGIIHGHCTVYTTLYTTL